MDSLVFKVVSRYRLAAEDKAHDEKKGEWNLHIRKSRATRWDYFLTNPQGGGGGSSSYTSIAAAFNAAVSRVNWEGKKKLYVVVEKWDYNAGEDGDYVTSKKFTVDIPEDGKPKMP